jgi:hypothetical protein
LPTRIRFSLGFNFGLRFGWWRQSQWVWGREPTKRCVHNGGVWRFGEATEREEGSVDQQGGRAWVVAVEEETKKEEGSVDRWSGRLWVGRGEQRGSRKLKWKNEKVEKEGPIK